MAANLAAAEAVIRAVLQHQHAYLFDAPVDPVLLGIPTYFHVIKTPMDLGTVLARLTRKQYSSASEVLRDANLVWHNCLTFNPPGDPVSVACCEVRQRFNELWRDAALPLTPAPPGPVLPPRAGSAAPAAPPRGDKKRKAPPPPPPPPAALAALGDDGGAGKPGGSATRCAVCAAQRRGSCGTPTAHARCERRTPGMPVVAPPKRARPEGAGAAAQPLRASMHPQASVEEALPPPSAAAVAARVKAANELAAAQETLRDTQARLAAALAAEGAARDAVRGMRPHDAPQPQLAPPGWVQRPPRATALTNSLATFWWGLRRVQPPARAA